MEQDETKMEQEQISLTGELLGLHQLLAGFQSVSVILCLVLPNELKWKGPRPFKIFQKIWNLSSDLGKIKANKWSLRSREDWMERMNLNEG